MKIQNRITELLKIELPIIQGGMVWVSGWKLVSAVSNNGGLGLIGAGSMKPELLKEHIQKCKRATEKSFGVNIPLLRKDSDELLKVVVEEGIKIVFSSAGNPAKYIDLLKKNNITVVHVVSNLKQALKAESVGCNAVVGEGVEAGGHNGLDEISMMSLIPQLVNELKIPVIAAGGIADKSGIEKALSLGAEGVQIGTLFAATEESSAHINYKQAIVNAGANDTTLIFKAIGLTRSIKNPFTKKAIELENKNATYEELKKILGEKRERLGIFEGDIDEGILEAGKGVGMITEIQTVENIFKNLS
ncbi:MAG: nitronate monooxygenase [Melioribacteraceae bacterium]|nr:nitronate monooxygenase [Melioribacteraceae bacterium]